MESKTKNTIEKRQKQDKELLLKELKKTPIVQIACQKTGIGRATYYRWRKEDKDFSKTADEAIREGELFINDMSESQIISLNREKNWSAISFWLRHHHPKYADKIKIDASIRNVSEELTPGEKALIRKALRLALPQNKDEKKEETNPQ